ncbi:hypothetical protein GCM10008929_20340 [Alkalibacterium psychrotolerans]
MTKLIWLQLLASVLLLICLGQLLYQGGIALDEGSAFETYFYAIRSYLFLAIGMGIVLLITTLFNSLTKFNKKW